MATAIALVVMDKHADNVDGKQDKLIAEEEKFRFKDIKSFDLSYWLISISCCLTYMAIFPFLEIVTDLL